MPFYLTMYSCWRQAHKSLKHAIIPLVVFFYSDAVILFCALPHRNLAVRNNIN